LPRLRTVAVGGAAAAVGKTLGSLGLPAMQVKVTAIRRTGTREVDPVDDEQVREGDVLVLLGTQENLARAEMRLLQG
ncbi:MAG: TrkA C-terminal domain-containing protein, partial [Usitatibacter sp.]